MQFQNWSTNTLECSFRIGVPTPWNAVSELEYQHSRVGCLGRHPRTQTIFFGSVQFKHHHHRCPKNTFADLWGAEVWVFGALPQNPMIFFGIVQFEHHHHRYPKTLLLGYGVQRYGCLGRYPRTQTMFFGIVQFKYPHHRYPKTLLLAYRVLTLPRQVLTLPR